MAINKAALAKICAEFEKENGEGSEHNFTRQDIHFKDIIDLYCFDRRLRSLIFNAIEKQKQQYAQKSYRYMLKVQVIAIGMRMKVYIASVMMI